MKKGVTLLEVILAMSLTIILLGLVIRSVGLMINVREKTFAIQETQGAIIAALDYIDYRYQNYTSVSSPSLGGSGSSLQIVEGATTRTFSISGGQLVETVGAVVTPLTSSIIEITSFSVENKGTTAPSIRIVINARLRIVPFQSFNYTYRYEKIL